MTIELGDISIARLIEMEGPFVEPNMLFPDATEEGMAKHKHWLAPQFVTEDGQLIMSIQTYVVKTRHHTILVDNGAHDALLKCDLGPGWTCWEAVQASPAVH